MDDKTINELVYFLMERVMQRSKEHTKDLFKKEGFGVTVDQWIILHRIYEKQEISQIEIANTTYKDPAAITRMLELLKKKGLVIKDIRPSDRRTHCVMLTPKGQELVSQMIPIVQEARALGFKGMSENDIQALKRLIDRMYDNLN